ncbi:hypothetical protein MPSEU_000791500 [Mayamaea pseudoterrestris]|nr:hypothetical protein MPSEU_000791500 [Mayamaea pseudoterrestris]
MSDEEQMIGDDVSEDDIFDRVPTKQERIEMRQANKPPSEWLRLLCKDWSLQNEVLVETADAKFIDYKPYLKGLLTPQLLYRLSVPVVKDGIDGIAASPTLDFWGILGISDEFDRSYITAQVERFCSLYNIRETVTDDDNLFPHEMSTNDPASLAAAAAAGINVSPNGALNLNFEASAAAAAAAAAIPINIPRLPGKQLYDMSQAQLAKEDAIKTERRTSLKRSEHRLPSEGKERKVRDREQLAVQKAAVRAERESEREARRQKKLLIRQHRELFAQQQKEAALQRAAELVASNRVPVEITRGSQAVKSLFAPSSFPNSNVDASKKRSAIVVSTAGDLNEIVTHSKNLWAKYNAIAKEHNQKVNWIIVAKELGIHVKVREKYARMHSRAEQRGFDWVLNSHWKVKDHPEIFLEPTLAEQKAKMPPSPLHTSATVLIDNNKEVSDEAVALAAAVVDASVTAPSDDEFVETSDEHHGTAAALAATSLVSDPIAGLEEMNATEV